MNSIAHMEHELALKDNEIAYLKLQLQKSDKEKEHLQLKIDELALKLQEITSSNNFEKAFELLIEEEDTIDLSVNIYA